MTKYNFKSKIIFMSFVIFTSCSTTNKFTKIELSTNKQYLGYFAGYKARIAASAYHYGNRTIEEIEEQEFIGFPPEMAEIEISLKEDGSVIAEYPPLNITRTAIYRDGLGITLKFNDSEEVLKYNKPKYPEISGNLDWPAGNNNAFGDFANIDMDLISKAYDDAFGRSEGSNKGNPDQIRAMLVLYNDKIVAEEYSEGFDMNTQQVCWSVSKTILNGLYGTYVKNNSYDIYSNAPIPQWQNQLDGRELITTDMLLRMRTGLEFKEVYFTPDDDTGNMLFNTGDSSTYAINKPLETELDKTFQYSSGTSNILSRALLNLHDGELDKYWDFIYEDFLYKLGMYNSTFETDETGTIIGSSFFYSTPRDLARLAILYKNNGVFNNQEIFNDNWVEYTLTPNGSNKDGTFGAHIWLNNEGIYDKVPRDMYFASGFLGQMIVNIPSKDLTIIRMGNSAYETFDFNSFMGNICRAVH